MDRIFLLSEGNSILGNTFFLNNGNGRFNEISDAIGAEHYWPWGLSVGDLNADGYQDAFLACSMNYPLRYPANILLLNNRGEQFLDSEYILGIEPRRDGRYAQPWFELDCSGVDRDHVDCEGRNGLITVWGALGSRSSVIFDLDNDGDLDLVTNEFNDNPMVLINNLTEKKGANPIGTAWGRWLTFKPARKPTPKCTMGYQGILRTASTRSISVWETRKRWTGDRIEVIWPSGQKQLRQGPFEINRLIQITEPIP